MGPINAQHYIPGSPESKGISKIATCTLAKKVIAFSEEFEDKIFFQFYNTTIRQGYKNFPSKISSYCFNTAPFLHCECLSFSHRKKTSNFLVALLSSSSSSAAAAPATQTKNLKLGLLVWNWDLESIRDQPFFVELYVKEPELRDKESEDESEEESGRDEDNGIKNENQSLVRKYDLAFATNTMENDCFTLTTRYQVIFYSISGKVVKPTHTISLIDESGNLNSYGNEIYSSCWLFDGSLCIISDLYLNFFDEKYYQLVQQIDNEESFIRLITPYSVSSSVDGFIATGKNRTLKLFSKRLSEEEPEGGVEKYYEYASKTKYEFSQTVNEKISGDKLMNADKISGEHMFDFVSVCPGIEESICIATTSNNDLIMIQLEEKEIDRAIVKYLCTPFHNDSIEGMDICINKPYIITCSTDKTVRVWDYQSRCHVISKTFEEKLYSIAYHPSGMHALVSSEDKIYPLNIFYDEIDNMTTQIQTKGKVKDIKFSNMGHLFAFDSGSVVQIWDFLNMQLYMGPPPYLQQKKNFQVTSPKIFYLNWRKDDKNLLISGSDYMYDWEVKDVHDKKPQIPGTNITSAAYTDKDKVIVCTTDDNCVRKIKNNSEEYKVEEFNVSMKELNAFKKSKILICATSRNVTTTEIAGQKEKILGPKICSRLRVFPDILKSKEYVELPDHNGETTRIRFNLEENKIFTAGEDGCINIYSIEIPFDSSEPEKYLTDQTSAFTNTVLIKKTGYKERDFDKKELPAKREEKLKKIRSENNDRKETDSKNLKDQEMRIIQAKAQEKKEISEMEEELQNNDVQYNNKIKQEIQSNDNEYDDQFNSNQLDLLRKTREVESIREMIKQQKEEHKAEIQRITEEAKEYREKHNREFEAKKRDLEGTKEELEGKIKSLKENQIEDSKALDWLNAEVIKEMKKNIDELSHKINELSVHYSHHIKKQIEEKEKLSQAGDNLNFELKKIEEEKERQQRLRERNEENKKKAEEDLVKMTKRISEIENKIIECKKAYTYLDKCKFVLTYKILELKKEAGPMEKVLNDLQMRTKEDELSLSKYNREFDIIKNKLVNLDELNAKTKEHEKRERELNNEINTFKIDLFHMLEYIDDYDKLREGFRNLRNKYLKGYLPEVQDHELEGEFSNQKSKMKSRVLELQAQLNGLRAKHKENIKSNREDNNEMINEIESLKAKIKLEKKNKETINGDKKHGNAVAEIFASQAVKKLMLENISVKDKIQVFKEKIKMKREELAYLKKTVKIDPIYMDEAFLDDDEEKKEEGGLNLNDDIM